MTQVPVIDIFAGPGGLGEGFSSFSGGWCEFDVNLSIEMDAEACETLHLRKFYNLFRGETVPDEYYEYVRGDISRETLNQQHPEEFGEAGKRVWRATLGDPGISPQKLSRRFSGALKGHGKSWVLVGGPPCQAYSVAGRTRLAGRFDPASPKRMEAWESYLGDHRHVLYEQYLDILARMGPTIFVMENVPGLLTTKLGSEESIFYSILRDLRDPCRAVSVRRGRKQAPREGYVIYSLIEQDGQIGLFGETGEGKNPENFIIQFEKYGVPQGRHRLILFGIRRDMLPGDGRSYRPGILQHQPGLTVGDAIGGLPQIRSRLSGEPDSHEAWVEAIRTQVMESGLMFEDPAISENIQRFLNRLERTGSTGGRFVEGIDSSSKLADWYLDPRLGGALNHEARSHMRSDLLRYYVLSCAAKAGTRLRISDFPEILLPDHRSVVEARARRHGYFNDRFKVQVEDLHSSTITAHISKDGHHFIHPDPSQCRSLTVREAARIQTFPDNYFFEGSRTAQYRQVGNAVPPLAAKQIARIASEVLREVMTA